MSNYSISKSDLTRIADAFIYAQNESKDKSNTGKSVAHSIRHVQLEIENVCPDTWW